jgi:hypothetical protein
VRGPAFRCPVRRSCCRGRRRGALQMEDRHEGAGGCAGRHQGSIPRDCDAVSVCVWIDGGCKMCVCVCVCLCVCVFVCAFASVCRKYRDEKRGDTGQGEDCAAKEVDVGATGGALRIVGQGEGAGLGPGGRGRVGEQATCKLTGSRLLPPPAAWPRGDGVRGARQHGATHMQELLPVSRDSIALAARKLCYARKRCG